MPGKLIGREDDVVHLLALAAHARLITITGPGGVGKTRISVEVEARISAELGCEAHRIELAELDASSTVAAISELLDRRSPEGVALGLGASPTLVVVDNCEHLLDAAAEFIRRVLEANDNVIIVATSRAPLGLADEHVVVLEPLRTLRDGDGPSPALQLFVERAHAAGATWTESARALEAADALCRHVDGLPLAIELAAARTRAVAPGDLLSLMSRRLDILAGAHLDRPPRHRSVRAAIEVSVESLTDEDRRLFASLGAVPGRWDLDLVARLCGWSDPWRAAEALAGLVERSLIVAEARPNSTDYSMLQLIHDYATETLHADGRWIEVNDRLAEVMADIADEIVDGGRSRWSPELMYRTERNTDNLIASIDWCIANDAEADRALRQFMPLFGSVHQRRSADVADVGERIEQRWPDRDGPRWSDARAVLATAFAMSNRRERAEHWAMAALAGVDVGPLARSVANRALMLVAVGVNDLHRALDHARAAADAARHALPPLAREMMALEASILDRLGAPEAAGALAAEAVDAAIDADDVVTEMVAHLVMITIASRRGDAASVQLGLDRARELFPGGRLAWWGNAMFRAQALMTVSEASGRAASAGWEASQPLWRAAIRRAADAGDIAEVRATMRAAAAVAARCDRDDVAYALLDCAPASGELVVLPELLDDELAKLEASRPPLGVGRAASLTMVNRALAALDDSVRSAGFPESMERAAGPAVNDHGATGGGQAVLSREPSHWTVSFDGMTTTIRLLKGIDDLAVLIGRSGREVHCVELMGADPNASPLVGDHARHSVQMRVLDLQQEIDDARRDNDFARVETHEAALEALIQGLSAAFGLDDAAAVERARTAVTRRINAAIAKIRVVHPGLGRHLAHSVRTGAWCAYEPELSVQWTVSSS